MMDYQHFIRDEREDMLIFVQKECRYPLPDIAAQFPFSRNMPYAPVPEQHGAVFFVTRDGIGINGDYGTNPPVSEMREMVDMMRECVRFWDEHYGVGT
jgi:hypothetical protein